MVHAEKWRFVIQPWEEYPPAVASIRVLNTDEDGHTILFLESMWVFGRRVFAEDELITVPLNRMANIPLGRGEVAGSMQRNQAPRDEKFAFLTYHVNDPAKQRGLYNQTSMSISHEDAVKWHKEFLRSMIFKQQEYDDIIHPMIEHLQIQTEEAVNYAGTMELESVFGSEIMEGVEEEAEEFVDILSDDQIIRLNYLSTGVTTNEARNDSSFAVELRSQTIEDLMENIDVDDDDIYAAHVSYLEGLAESRYDNWESSNAE